MYPIVTASDDPTPNPPTLDRTTTARMAATNRVRATLQNISRPMRASKVAPFTAYHIIGETVAFVFHPFSS